MTVLAFIWIALVVVSIVDPMPAVKQGLAFIWYVFIGDFCLRALVAPDKRNFLKHNWLGTISLLLPALRAFQIFSFLTTMPLFAISTHGTLLLILSSINRSMSALGKLMRRRGTGYVVTLTFIVIVASAAGVLSYEKPVHAANGIHNIWQALYWAAMMVTTIGSDYWPQTAGGKLLTVCLSLYGVAILSYIAAALASFFVGHDARDKEGDIASSDDIRELRHEICRLRSQIHYLIQLQTGTDEPAPACPTGETESDPPAST